MLRGHIQNGVVVFDQPVALPEGTIVRIEPDPEEEIPTLAERLGDLIGKAEGLPPDFASQHDHYIHGTPRR